MATNYLQCFPPPLLDDLVAGRWLPIVGAGFSRNATLPPSRKMPLWSELGEILGAELGEYAPTNPIDAISAYEQEYGRPKLIEKISEALLVGEARPSNAHRAFCAIPFDLVCTTNFDFLLERQYELIPRNCTPLVDEEQLAVNIGDGGVALLKLHGDLHHPERLVATETDYDCFLERYPLLATFLANLLITRTAVLVGYSFDDPDFRQIWQVVGERLGRSRRMAYAVAVDAKRSDILRFERRGVRVINLPGGKRKYRDVLTNAFTEVRDFWRAKLIPASQVKEEQSLHELSLPPEVPTRICFFAVPLTLMSFYRERVFPLVRESGFVPVTADDVVSPGDAIFPKIEALIERARLIVVDASTQHTLSELRLAARKLAPEQILVITEASSGLPSDISRGLMLKRPDVSSADPEEFLTRIRNWLESAADTFRPELLHEPARLLEAGEYRAAVIAAISLLETHLRQRLDLPRRPSARGISMRALFEQAQNQGLLGSVPVKSILEWLGIRNEVVHSQRVVTRAKAKQIVSGVDGIVRTGHKKSAQ